MTSKNGEAHFDFFFCDKNLGIKVTEIGEKIALGTDSKWTKTTCLEHQVNHYLRGKFFLLLS